MSETHIVEQGEHLSLIAKKYGFPDYKIVWDHPENADLKKLRKNPNILFPGDEVFIPDKEEKDESGPTDKRHSFVVDKEKLKLRLVLEDMLERPIAGAQCDVSVDGDVQKLTTDKQGKLERDIPNTAHDGVLVIHGDQTPLVDFPMYLKIGDLDPVTELSGQVARLNNLGYFPGDGTDEDAFQSAVEEFQCDHGLKIDGDCGTHTQTKLEKVHGC